MTKFLVLPAKIAFLGESTDVFARSRARFLHDRCFHAQIIALYLGITALALEVGSVAGIGRYGS
jgi:hypothetical protein